MLTRTVPLSLTLALVACGPAATRPVPSTPAARTQAPPPTSRPTAATAPATRTAAAKTDQTLENACDAVCLRVAQSCEPVSRPRELAEVSRCVKACMADRLSAGDRRCYRARSSDKNMNARHLFCGHRLGWPRLRPGGCIPAASSGWVPTRVVPMERAPCKPGFVGVRTYPADSGAPHLAYCDAAGKLRVALQPELAAKGHDGRALQRVARAKDRLVILHARRANCGAQLTLGLVDLTGNRSAVRDVKLDLGRKRWTVRLEIKAGRALIKAPRDWLSVPLEPATDDAVSGRCAKLRAKYSASGKQEEHQGHPCIGTDGDPDHCP